MATIEITSQVKKVTIEIPKHKLSTFERLIKDIRKQCKYLNLPLPVITDLPDKTYFIAQHKRSSNKRSSSITSDYTKIKKYIDNNNDCEIISQSVHIKEIEVVESIVPQTEWEVLGIIDHVEGIIINTFGNHIPYNLVPNNLQSSHDCDHCNTKRLRNKTIYIQHKDNKSIKRVGGSCIKYYLGFDYDKVLQIITHLDAFFNFTSTIDVWDEDFVGGFGGKCLDEGDKIVDTRDIIKYFFNWVVTEGYISKASAEKISIESDNEKLPTSQIVKNYLGYIFTPPRLTGFKKDEEYYQEWVKDVRLYNETISKVSDKYFDIVKGFVEERYQDSNFLINTKNFLEVGFVKIKHLKYIVSACSMYWGMKLSEEINKNKDSVGKKSNFIGEIGKKANLINLTITQISTFETQFGISKVYKMVDNSGNIYTKFGTINPRFITEESEVKNIENNAVVSFTADIKKHDTFKGVKQTILGRISKAT